ncbi:hypothetical protein Desor_5094 [Desulfosporosinus orientis DSM 765]|uniref:Uncharacterized protein n=1 Tax=Desulfosporosinus orientis (strain ATCC 19365 / DSM 765 / NCIMB 8382 / VKM B-1628 / Singapore I) TaxID=768706 RepID=G7WJP8_DESOD|nr:hypothetical protein [Desulfosporosinus orientis]AET70485.1 hypothetical protein Desor_5094 [Desulfosporosinus orientis DSM 765]
MKLMIKAILLIFLVFYLSGCGTSANSKNSQTPQTAQDQTEASSNPSSQPPLEPAQPAAADCRWIGVDQDIVSPNEIKADGKQDGHFHLTLSVNQSVALKSIMIRYSEFGKSLKWTWIYNQNLPIQGYVMGLVDESGKAILPQGDNGYIVNGLTDFDLYLSELENENGRDTLKFAANQTFDLQINYVTEKNEEKEFRNTLKIQSEGTNGVNP